MPSASATLASRKVEAPRADAFFTVGRRHAVCQDYALARTLSAVRAWAVVADGCSSSPLSDFGARFLARAVDRHLHERGDEPDLALMARRALGMAVHVLGPGPPTLALGGPGPLDATLYCAWLEGDDVRVLAAGDGMIVARRRDGAVETIAVEVPDGAPCYPSYLLDRGRREAYLEATDGARRTITRFDGAQVLDVATRRGLEPDRFAFPRTEYELVVLLSDGVRSFRGRDGAVPASEIVREVLALTSPRGEFLVRRCRRFLGRTCARRGWRHDDDFGAAALWWGAAG